MSDKWISVEDRFPPKGDCIVFNTEYGVGNIHFAWSDGVDHISDAGFYSNRLYKVTYWMPRPKPPTEDR